jgi:hypothetical protein
MPIMHEGAAILGLEQMIKTKLHRGNLHVLVKWKGQLAAKILVEGAELIKQPCQTFQLEDKLILHVGRGVMVGKTHSRRTCPDMLVGQFIREGPRPSCYRLDLKE